MNVISLKFIICIKSYDKKNIKLKIVFGTVVASHSKFCELILYCDAYERIINYNRMCVSFVPSDNQTFVKTIHTY